MNLLHDLQQLLSPEQVTTNQTTLEMHSRDESYHIPHLPDVVVFPKDSGDVRAILEFANTHHIPVVPFGVGSSLEGHVIPYQGGISMDFSLMNRIMEIRPSDFLVKVQPGVTRNQLNKELKKYGLFFSVDPGADATIGGMVATNASGTTAVRYGVMRDQVRDLEVVLANGEIIRTGGLAAKSSSGYHLTSLFVGSEGTLGVFTEIVLRVYGIPEHVMAARACFPTVQQTVSAAIAILSSGIPIAKIELVDAPSIAQTNAYSGTNYPVNPTLFLEFSGNLAGMKQDIEFAQSLANEEDCIQFTYETDSKQRAKLWESRHNLAYAYKHSFPGKQIMGTDVCVPLSSLAASIEHARLQIESFGINGAVFGHVGDGNYHTLLVIDPNNPEDMQRAEKINAEIVKFALSCGGTCTGEHGVGIGKMKYQFAEHGHALSLMLSMKKMLDPYNILNPGKLLPTDLERK